MGTSSGPGHRDELPSRLTQRAPDTPEDSTDYGGGNLVGSEKGSRDISGRDQAKPEEQDAKKRKDGKEAKAKDQPIGSALASATGRNDDAAGGGATAGAGSDLSSGPDTLGATSGGERASAGSSDSNRSSRDHRNILDE